MKINAKIRKQANAIIMKYTGWKLPCEIRHMYDELNEIGIEIPMFSDNACKSHPFLYNGEEVENSRFVYMIYEPIQGMKNDYTMYIS